MGHPAVLVAWSTAVVVLLVDQLSKVWAVATLEGQPDRPIIGELLQFSFVRNPGAAFGLGSGATIVFSLVAIIVAAVLLRMSTKLVSMWWAVALGLMLAGAVGNLLDRIFRSRFPAGACRGLPAIAQLAGVQRRRHVVGHRCGDDRRPESSQRAV